MCGIVGYAGPKPALPYLLDLLQRVTYRGYDSFGVAVANGGGIDLFKATGTVENKLLEVPPFRGTIGIGHTRWATVGRVSVDNAHPHLDCSGKFVVVHNGDIDNFLTLRVRLQAQGHTFRSDTDSEVIAHLIEAYYQDDLLEAVHRAAQELQGSYAIAVLRSGCSQLVAARKESPLVIGLGEEQVFIASDVPALLPYTNRVIYLEDDDLAVVEPGDVRVTQHGCQASRKVHVVNWSASRLEKDGYPHFMLKEINEQPRVIADTLSSYLTGSYPRPALGSGTLPAEHQWGVLLGCGTSYHAALVGEHILSSHFGVRVAAKVASEFQPCRAPQGAFALALSQSGETADTLSALRRAQEAGYATLAITNVPGSSISRLAETTIYTQAGPEIAVASTKTFTAQLITLYLLSLGLAPVAEDVAAGVLRELRRLPTRVQRVLSNDLKIREVAQKLAGCEHLFLVAKGINFPIALEGALKFKEIPYVHAEGCPAGELKHGPLALSGPGTPMVAIAASDEHYGRVLTSMKEVRLRGSPVIALASEDNQEVHEFADAVLTVPPVAPAFSPVLYTVVLQLLSYYCAVERGCPIDRPRNLAKSVTVP